MSGTDCATVQSMPIAAAAPPELLTGPFLGADAVARKLVTAAQLRSKCWRRVFRGVYVWHLLPDTLALRAAAAALVLPAGATVSGVCAAWLHGADVLPPDAP